MKQKRHKIISRVSEEDYQRLERITKMYGFKSVYGLQIYITHCFLKVTDPSHNRSNDVIPEELIKMFPIKHDAEDVYRAIKRIRRHHRYCKVPKSPGLFDKTKDTIHDEIAEMFNDAEDSGGAIEFSDNLRKRSER